jgi:hypothetical protein
MAQSSGAPLGYFPRVGKAEGDDELTALRRNSSPTPGSKRSRSTPSAGRPRTAIRRMEASGSWITRTARNMEAARLAFGVSRTKPGTQGSFRNTGPGDELVLAGICRGRVPGSETFREESVGQCGALAIAEAADRLRVCDPTV